MPEAELDRWLDAPGWEALVNRRGTTWRRLDAATRASVVDAAAARAVLLAHPSLVKRPVVDWAAGPTRHDRVRCRALGGVRTVTGCCAALNPDAPNLLQPVHGSHRSTSVSKEIDMQVARRDVRPPSASCSAHAAAGWRRPRPSAPAALSSYSRPSGRSPLRQVQARVTSVNQITGVRRPHRPTTSPTNTTGAQYTTRTDTHPGPTVPIEVGAYGVATTLPVARAADRPRRRRRRRRQGPLALGPTWCRSPAWWSRVAPAPAYSPPVPVYYAAPVYAAAPVYVARRSTCTRATAAVMAATAMATVRPSTRRSASR